MSGAADRALAWRVAVAMLPLLLAAALAIGLAQLRGALVGAGAGALTIEIAAADPAVRERQAAATLATLAAAAIVDDARRIDVRALVRPWLGPLAYGDLPLPALIEVRPAAKADPDRIAALVRPVAPGAAIDARGLALAPLLGLARTANILAWAAALALAAAVAGAAWNAGRRALGREAGDVELLHLLGATDARIAAGAAREIGRSALAGGVGALVVALPALLAIDRALAGLDAELAEAARLGIAGWIALALLPPAAAALAALAAMLAARRMLAALP